MKSPLVPAALAVILLSCAAQAATHEVAALSDLAGVTLARGTWGSSASGAEHVDDAHFAGAGVLRVARDELVRPLVILMR